MVDVAWWETILRLVLAATFGGLLGLEREHRHKDAGLRTHVIVALGAGVFGLVSVGAFDARELAGAPHAVTVDVTRIASYVAAGVGFIGAGIIRRGDDGDVRGLTTAASLWVAAAVGLAAGLGYWEAGLTGALIGLAVLRLPDRPHRRRRRG